MTGSCTLVVNNKPVLDANKLPITTDEVVSNDIVSEPVLFKDPMSGKRTETGQIMAKVQFEIIADFDPDAEPRSVVCAATTEEEGWLRIGDGLVPQWHAFALGRAISSLPKGTVESVETPFMNIFPPIGEEMRAKTQPKH